MTPRCAVPGCRRVEGVVLDPETQRGGPCDFYKPKGRKRGSCGGTSPLPEGKQYLPHQGRRERMRRIAQLARVAERKLVRLEAILAPTPDLRARLLDFASGLPDGNDSAFLLRVADLAIAAGDEAAGQVGALLERVEKAPRVDRSWFERRV